MRHVGWLLPWIVLAGCQAEAPGGSGAGGMAPAGEVKGAAGAGAGTRSTGVEAAGAAVEVAAGGGATGAAAPARHPAVGAQRTQAAAAVEDPDSARKREALEGLMRRMDFERQDRIDLPPGMPAAVTALVPADESVKLIEVTLLRRMHQTRPAPGRREVALRWMCAKRGEALDALVQQALVAGGWITAGEPARSPITHPTQGTLTWAAESPSQRAAWVRFEVVDADPAGALTLPVEWLVAAPAWGPAVAGQVPIGFEYRHYHGRRPGTVYSDFENLVAAYRVTGEGAFVRALEAAAVAGGYEVDDDATRLLRGPGPSTLTTRVLDDGVVVVHHQRRWARPAPAGSTREVAPDKPGVAPPTDGTAR